MSTEQPSSLPDPDELADRLEGLSYALASNPYVSDQVLTAMDQAAELLRSLAGDAS